jgi:hypothetical protein
MWQLLGRRATLALTGATALGRAALAQGRKGAGSPTAPSA